ncbi:other/SCY1 protein kinase [Pholiota molesta]|nr:other/SCY1 protein kinase [Pholiota molesta]
MLAAATSFFARTNISQSYNIGNSAPPGLGTRPSTPSGSTSTSLSAPPAPTPTFYIGLWKRGPDMERLGAQGKDRVIEVMKAEKYYSYWSTEMVEPLEETRSEIMFATEPQSGSVELDEIEIQKGILQLCKGLSFLHTSAKLIHSNIWRLEDRWAWADHPPSNSNGAPSNWEFPTFDGRVPPYIQRSFDYMAPEYALDEQLVTASDMYSLGCWCNPPFKNHASKPVPGMERLEKDLQVLLRSLITRHYGSRPTPESLPSHAFFSSLPISTLNFLDRSNFTAKTREEKISFMKGLSSVLDRFSEGLRTRKILPSLLEEVKPPQNMLTLLDNLTMLQDKTDKNVFREPLESEHAIVQERALKAVPGLCESIDYAEVQSVLFPRVAVCYIHSLLCFITQSLLVAVFTKTRILSSSLTQKLVPLLSKIRTKEPAVMMATLSVQEAMGFKVDREAVATLVLPQLWSMSIGPLLSVGQFQRFMQVIKKLGDRVEKEHDQFLRDSQRLEDLGNANGPTVKPDTAIDSNANWDDDVWGSIFSTNTTTGSQQPLASPTIQSRPATISHTSPPLPSNTTRINSYQTRSSNLNATSIATSSPPTVSPANLPRFSPPPSNVARPSYSQSSFPTPPRQPQPPSFMSQPVQSRPSSTPSNFSGPNYNIQLSSQVSTPSTFSTATTPMTFSAPSTNPVVPLLPQQFSMNASTLPTLPQMGGGLLMPSKPAQSSTTRQNNMLSKDDWGDFDPLS